MQSVNPLNFLILLSLFVLGGSQAPTAVILEDHGPLAQQLFDAMSHAHSFRLIHAASAMSNSSNSTSCPRWSCS